MDNQFNGMSQHRYRSIEEVMSSRNDGLKFVGLNAKIYKDLNFDNCEAIFELRINKQFLIYF